MSGRHSEVWLLLKASLRKAWFLRDSMWFPRCDTSKNIGFPTAPRWQQAWFLCDSMRFSVPAAKTLVLLRWNAHIRRDSYVIPWYNGTVIPCGCGTMVHFRSNLLNSLWTTTSNWTRISCGPEYIRTIREHNLPRSVMTFLFFCCFFCIARTQSVLVNAAP